MKVKRLDHTRRFYEALGYTLVEEQHRTGPIHFSVDFGGCVYEFYPAEIGSHVAPPKGDFWIVDVRRFDDVLRVANDLDLDRDPVKYYDPEQKLRSAIFEDPDGRRILVREVGQDPPPPVH
jgi:catechol 2,3-dioxygenase-like lactoylglutathione lyase family enzyme